MAVYLENTTFKFTGDPEEKDIKELIHTVGMLSQDGKLVYMKHFDCMALNHAVFINLVCMEAALVAMRKLCHTSWGWSIFFDTDKGVAGFIALANSKVYKSASMPLRPPGSEPASHEIFTGEVEEPGI